ncbi:MAG: hypothetical protein NC311_10135 [Muribaculaceae bacterium]|nr:hypothetical protein [Muribaculaceae bacterium]
MTDLDAACLLKEPSGRNAQGLMRTPQMQSFDTVFQCAFGHAIRALEERAGAKDPAYAKSPNGSYSINHDDRKETPI